MKITNYKINEDLTVDVYGDVNLEENALKFIPVQFNIVEGYFDCCGNELTNLKGCPKEVGRNFYCAQNKLISLEGGPIKVGGDFICSSNNLTSLEFCPEQIDGDFYFSSNKVTNLQHFPNEIGGEVEAYDNPIETILGFNGKFQRKLYHDTFIIPELEHLYVQKRKVIKSSEFETVLEIEYENLIKILNSLKLKKDLENTLTPNSIRMNTQKRKL